MTSKTLLSFTLALVFLGAKAQVPIPATTIVSENFNSIAAGTNLPANWKMSAAGAGATAGWTTVGNLTAVSQVASSGLPATGGAYNWGTTPGTDRAIGFMTSAIYTSPNSIMAYYRNTTGSSVSSVTISFAVERYIINSSTASVSFAYSTDGNTFTAQSTGDINTADFPTGANAATFTTPKTLNRTVTINVSLANNADIYFRWVFISSNTNVQGLGLDNVSVFAGTPTPVMSATLVDLLQVDNGTPNQFNEGDVIRYQTVVKNSGTGNANNVEINLPTPPANTTMVPGSIKTSAVAVDDDYTTSFNTILNATTVLVNDIGIPVPTAVLTYGPTGNATLYNAGNAGTTNAGGTITLNANGTFSYTPPAGFSGIDKFAYITGNGNLPNNDAVVNITVAPDITFNTTNVDPSCNNGTNGSITFNATGGNGTLQYSITGAAGTYQASNVFTGLASGLYNLAVKDAGGYIKTSTTTLNNPAPLVVNGSAVINLIYNTAVASVTYTNTGGTGTINWSATGLPTGVSINSTSGAGAGTPTVTGSFSASIIATDLNGCTASINITVNVAPKLTNDSYTSVVGNTQLVADAHSAPATPFTSDATNIITNDASNAAIAITAVTNAATTSGGTITIGANGKFIYSPPNGFTGSDSYSYTGTSNSVAATATINFTIANMVWYVNNTYAGANGTANGSSHRPYTDLATTSTAAQINQIIFVHTGSGNTTGNTTLKSGQTLRGAGNALTVGTLSISAGTKPTLSGTITLANSVSVDGLDMSTGTLTAITNGGATVTGVNVNVGTVTTTTTGGGIALTGTGNNVTMALASLTTNGAVNAINLTGTAGTVTVNAGSLTGGAGAVINVNGGTVSLTYSGSASQGTATQPLLSVSGGHSTGTVLLQTGTMSATNGTGLQFDNADGTYNFFGTTTLGGGDAGVDILNGSGGTFNFATTSGTMSITSPTGIAFNVGGTANTATITYDGNITQASNAAMVSITNHATNAITFPAGNTLSATNGSGLQFDNADAAYTFSGTVTLNGGDAAIDILNGSAGTFSFPSTTSITNPTNEVLRINASTANVTYSGSFSKTSATTGILVNGETGGTITINGTGTKSLSTSTGNAISLTSNTGATINFSGNNLLLTTTSGVGFNATGGGTISVAGTGNIIISTTGSALNVANTTIGAGNLNFQSISSNGGSAPGIILNTTGATGGLIVNGDGSNTTKGGNSSGGIISNKDDLATNGSSTLGTAIYLNSTSGVTLRRMTVNGVNQNYGIFGTNVTNIKIEYSSIVGTNGDNVASREGTVIFGNIFGNANSIFESIISGSIEDNIRIENTSGTLTSFNLTNSNILNNSTVSGNIGFRFATVTLGVSMTGTVSNCLFQGNRTDEINVDASNGSVNISVLNNTIIRGTAGNNEGNLGINISVANNGVMLFDVQGNKIGTDGVTNQPLLNTGINIFNGTLVTSGTPASITGVIKNNIVYNAGAGMSGFGISLFNQGYGTLNANVTNNTVNNVGLDYGIRAEVSSNGGTANAAGSLSLALTNNISNVLAGGLDAIRVQVRGRSNACLRISGNSSSTHGTGFFGIELRQANQTVASVVYTPTVNLEGLAAGAQTNPTVINYLNSQNPGIVGGCDAIIATSITGVANSFCGSIPVANLEWRKRPKLNFNPTSEVSVALQRSNRSSITMLIFANELFNRRLQARFHKRAKGGNSTI